jgi:hypothetical protein
MGAFCAARKGVPVKRFPILSVLLACGLSACGPSSTPPPSPEPLAEPTLASVLSATVLAPQASSTPLPSATEAVTATLAPTPTPTTAPISPANLDDLSQVVWSIVGRSPRLSHDGRLLAFAACDDPEAEYPSCSSERYTTLQIWDTEAVSLLLEVPSAHSDSITDVAFSPDDASLATAGEDGWVRLFDTASGEILQALRFAGGDEPAAVGFSRDGSMLAAGEYVWQTLRAAPTAQNGVIQVWETATGRPIMEGPGTYQFSFSPDGRLLATRNDAYGDLVLVYDVRSGQRLHGLPLPDFDQLSGILFTPDGSAVITGGNQYRGGVWIWDIETGELLNSLDDSDAPDAFAVSADGRWLLSTGSTSYWTRMWDTTTWEPLGSFETPFAANRLSMTDDGVILARLSGGRAEIYTDRGGRLNRLGLVLSDALHALAEARYQGVADLLDSEARTALAGIADALGTDPADPAAALAAACSRAPGCLPPSRLVYQEVMLDRDRAVQLFAYVEFDGPDGVPIAAPCAEELDYYGCSQATWFEYTVLVDEGGAMRIYGFPLPLQLEWPE